MRRAVVCTRRDSSTSNEVRGLREVTQHEDKMTADSVNRYTDVRRTVLSRRIDIRR